ncbi:hypothetical protein H4P12_12380 [Paracoccus sp. 11-3]|uniref:Uncharacterized protein n=1 Tax=Paracoccus amoyensis TaxID=2760093 RepID=A0A926GP98_9RHOB|nr:hypothetical protein [Paracoccus amoyensis]MBC9247490.1 hypothetical protein [Paracoccus amoyensis]
MTIEEEYRGNPQTMWFATPIVIATSMKSMAYILVSTLKCPFVPIKTSSHHHRTLSKAQMSRQFARGSRTSGNIQRTLILRSAELDTPRRSV